MDCLQGNVSDAGRSPSICRRKYPFCGRDIPQFEDPSGLGKKHPWMTKTEIQKCFIVLRECFFPRHSHMFSSCEELGQNGLTHLLPSNITRARGRSLPLHQSLLIWSKERTIMYFGIGFWACCLYLGLESTYSSSLSAYYTLNKSVYFLGSEKLGGTSKAWKNWFFATTIFVQQNWKWSNATTSFL
jgi:hypothetical protein